MDTEQLKKNFDEQLVQAEKQIAELESNLEKAREYKLKLQGGLETLVLLAGDQEAEPETSTEEPLTE
tara:strand:- start:1228 stop:1428 length:201 start_codon:yes stop_codon:yes gene_type:complete